MSLSAILRRQYSSPAVIKKQQAWLFVDSVFPIQIASWDLRHYIGIFRQKSLLTDLESRLQSVKTHDFRILKLDPQRKDGGVFVRFEYNSSNPSALSDIQSALRQHTNNLGGLPSWNGLARGNVWLVMGEPWREDMNRFASPILKFSFDGPDVHEQSLYDLCRPYGRITDLSLPVPVPPGAFRSATVTFARLNSATIARNVIHGLDLPASDSAKTRLRATYQAPIQPHVVRNWISSHPKIVLPLFIFLFGSLTYIVFDPIRVLMVEGTMLDWFDYRQYKLYQWLRVQTFDRIAVNFRRDHPEPPAQTVWKERDDAVAAMRGYLTDIPSTVAFVHGPQGSGKTRMLQSVLKDTGRDTLFIDLKQLHKATSDSQLVGALAKQTGYWPVFTFLNSVNNLLDLASVGLIGQKAGLSSSISDQMQQILTVVGTALKNVSARRRAAMLHQMNLAQAADAHRLAENRRRERLVDGTWHDGRIDCVCGNGIMSELGVGDERFDADTGSLIDREEGALRELEREEVESEKRSARERRTREEMETVKALPIVVIRGYAARTGAGTGREELLVVLAQWAATLVESQVAHVVVISDNRENMKRLAQALPSKPLNAIALSDADPSSSMLFVQKKLQDAGMDIGFSPAQIAYVERLGGRASDLESLIHKVQAGLTVEAAVEDIIQRAIGGLWKNGFGDDADDAQGLPWTREQAWHVLRLLAKKPEAPYYDVLVDFPFKGDETALRAMEHAELISIGTVDGRPSTIRPGKPVLRWAFERLVSDPIFQATQDLAYNEKQISKAEGTVATCEAELGKLKEMMDAEPRRWWDLTSENACQKRAVWVSRKMLAAERKIEELERRNVDLKKVLAGGG